MPDGKTEEHDTFSCHHCQRITIVKAGVSPVSLGGFCRQCGKLICSECAKTGICAPFNKKLEREINKSLARKSYGF